METKKLLLLLFVTLISTGVFANNKESLINRMSLKHSDLIKKGIIKVEDDTCLIFGPSIPLSPRFYTFSILLSSASIAFSGLSINWGLKGIRNKDLPSTAASAYFGFLGLGSFLGLHHYINRFQKVKNEIIVKITKNDIEFPTEGISIKSSEFPSLKGYINFEYDNKVNLHPYLKFDGEIEQINFSVFMLRTVFVPILNVIISISYNLIKNAFDYTMADRGIAYHGKMLLLNEQMSMQQSKFFDVIQISLDQ